MDQYYRNILAYQSKVLGYIDDHNHPAAQVLKQEVQRLEDDVQVRKSMHSIDDQLKRVIRAVEHAGSSKAVSHHHTMELARLAEHFREQLRKIK